MEGADEYYDLFEGKSQQFGRLYLQCNRHARGKCFEINLMPKGMKGSGDYVSGEDVIEVYGMTGGQRGWTETYGWIHKGRWVDDFMELVEHKKKEMAELLAKRKKMKKSNDCIEKDRIDALLESY